jgi:hypothetical protein
VSQSAPSRYPVARATTVMALGGMAVIAGVLVVALAVVRAVRGDGAAWSVLWWVVVVLAVAAGVGLLRALWRLARPPVGLRLDDAGYTVDPSAGAGVRSAAWSDVARVAVVEGPGERGAVVHLGDGRTTRVVARMLAGDPRTWLEDLDARLDRAHGQRRL